MPKAGLAVALVVTLAFSVVALLGYARSDDSVVTAERRNAVVASGFVIPAGREARVVEWLRPVAEVVAPLQVAGYSIEKSEIRVQLSDGSSDATPCSLANWVKPPGALVITRGTEAVVVDRGRGSAQVAQTRVSSQPCDRATALLGSDGATELARELEHNYAGDIWTQVAPPPPPMVDVVGGMADGIPGVSPKLLSIGTMGGAFVLALAIGAIVAFRQRSTLPSATPAVHAWIGWLILAGGLIARVVVAAVSSLDTDESCAVPPEGPLRMFTTEHDALVHPPLPRAVYHTWSDWIGWGDQSAEWLLRVPSLLAACAALALVTTIVVRAGKTQWRWLPLAVLSFEPQLVRDSVLARPYSLACLFVVCTLYCVWPQPSSSRIQNGIRWGLAVFAASLAAWADVLAGAAALGGIVIACLQSRPQVHRFAALAAAGVGLYALAPGILDAVATGITPAVPDGMPNLRPDFIGFGRTEFGPALLTTSSLAVWGINAGGFPGMVALAILLWAATIAFRSRDPYLIWSVLGVGMLAATDTFLVGLRPRNVLFLPYGTAVALAICADPLVAWVRQRRMFARAESH